MVWFGNGPKRYSGTKPWPQESNLRHGLCWLEAFRIAKDGIAGNVPKCLGGRRRYQFKQ